jgi:clorobiocin biosynthesis protein CloN5
MEQNSSIERVVQSYIAQTFLDGDDQDLDASSPLLEWGILDSMGMTLLLKFLEERFAVKIGEEAITPKNFRDVRSISSLVTAYSLRPPEPESAASHGEEREVAALIEYGAERVRYRLDSGAELHGMRMPGDAPRWVLLPEPGQAGSYFDELQRRLESFHESLALDLAGFGRSHCPNPEPTLWDQLACISEVLLQPENDRAVLIAHGATALIAAEYARRHPERVQALVVIGFGAFDDPEALWSKQQALAGNASEYLSAHYHAREEPDDEQLAALSARLARPAFRSFFDRDAFALAKSAYDGLVVPTLFVCGQDDAQVGVDAVDRAAALVAGSAVKWLARTGHGVPRERPDELMSLIETFLRARKPNGGVR